MEQRLSEVTAILSRTPATLRALLQDLPVVWLEADEGEGTFTPRDVVGHLIHGERTDWISRIKVIVDSGDSRPFAPFDRLGFRDAIRGRPTGALLDEFESLRGSNLGTLRDMALTPAQLTLEGHHPALGPVTLGQLLATWAVHDLDHIGQVARVLGKRYATAVGPWEAYLGILNR